MLLCHLVHSVSQYPTSDSYKPFKYKRSEKKDKILPLHDVSKDINNHAPRICSDVHFLFSNLSLRINLFGCPVWCIKIPRHVLQLSLSITMRLRLASGLASCDNSSFSCCMQLDKRRKNGQNKTLNWNQMDYAKIPLVADNKGFLERY